MTKVIWSLFDGSGLMGEPWARNGHKVYCINFDDGDHGGYGDVRVQHPNIEYVNYWIKPNEDIKSGIWRNLLPPDLVFSFPPCTDMAVSGAAHFAKKFSVNPLFQINAVNTALVASKIAEEWGCPYMIENPVSVLSSKWRKPDYKFNPFDYGGYLGVDDKHPFFPKYINPRDSYPKKTCLWTGNGFIMPPKKPVAVATGFSEQHKKLGGKSKKTKLIRSMTPRGFATAVYDQMVKIL